MIELLLAMSASFQKALDEVVPVAKVNADGASCTYSKCWIIGPSLSNKQGKHAGR